MRPYERPIMNAIWYLILFTVLINANLMFGVYQYFLWKKIQDDKQVLSDCNKTTGKLLDLLRARLERDEEEQAEEMIKDIEDHLKNLE